MSLFIFLLVFVFLIISLFFSRSVVLMLEEEADREILKAQQIFEEFLQQREQALMQRTLLERRSNAIFSLYEMTKEITQELSQDEIFYIFRSKVRKHVTFEDCHWQEEEFVESKEKTAEGVFFFPLKDNQDTMGYLVFTGIRDEDKETIVILSYQFALAIRRVRLYQRIEKIALTDNLTGVYTRRYFLERFAEEVKRAQIRKISLSFLMLDVDFFKNFNDQYGHLTGDQILKEMGTIIKAGIREIDIAGRYGGEEFCMVLPETDTEGAILVAERIRLAVEKTSIKAYEATVQTTVSIGVATLPVHASSATALLDKADWALYRAKKSGRNRVCAFWVYKD